MKITIDTKEDSHEEIQKAIRLLSALIGDKEIMSSQGDIFGDNSTGPSGSSGSSGGVFDMFNASSGSDANKAEEAQEKKKEEDIDIDIPGLEEYS